MNLYLLSFIGHLSGAQSECVGHPTGAQHTKIGHHWCSVQTHQDTVQHKCIWISPDIAPQTGDAQISWRDLFNIRKLKKRR